MCLCLLTRTSSAGPQVLLGRKKTGLGAGKVVGLGGHVEPGESAGQAAAREVKEESGVLVQPDALRHAAYVEFRFPARPRWDQAMDVFTATDWHGEPAESAEISPQWYAITQLPLADMWDDAAYWLPRVLAGEHIQAAFTYADDCQTVARASLSPADGEPA